MSTAQLCACVLFAVATLYPSRELPDGERALVPLFAPSL